MGLHSVRYSQQGLAPDRWWKCFRARTATYRDVSARPPTVSTEEVARERIDRLQALARDATVDGHEKRARRYVRRARRIAERNRLALPREFVRFTCDRCDAYLRPGRNARIRLQDGHVVVTCDCGGQERYPYEG
jgi:ribonuclease P protein subunit RPR2